MSTPIKPGQLITEIISSMWNNDETIECYLILGYEYGDTCYPTTMELSFKNKECKIERIRKIPNTIEELYLRYDESIKFIFH